MKIDGGSFRDPESRVFIADSRVFRGLSADAAEIDLRVRESGLLDRLVATGVIIENWRVEDIVVPSGVPSAAVVESRRLPVVSYPGEWSFPMLRDAALLTLDANLAALDSGFILKDASAFNVVFEGGKPLIIDVSSLDAVENHAVWTAYGQFVDHFVAPLMLEAYTGMPFQPVLSTSIEGFPVGMLNQLLSGGRRYRRGVMTHVRLRSRIEGRADAMAVDERSRIAAVSLPVSAIQANMKKLRRLVMKLESPNVGRWEGYEASLPYAASETDAKRTFVEGAVATSRGRDLALDVGANEGLFTATMIDRFDHVVAIDNDPGVVGALYTSLEGAGRDRLTPLVVDIVNPSPAYGLRGRERPGFADRVRPDFSTWLAVIHHLSIGQGIPLSEIVELVAETSPEAVVEFVDPADPMVQQISASRPDRVDGYDRTVFEDLLRLRFDVVRAEPVSGTRTMYHIVRRDY